MSPLADQPLAPGTIVANNYRVTARLGAGGMGTVYLADNVTLSQRVVVKVLRGGPAGAGHEEAQLLASLQHPNVVTVFAHDPAHDCIVMEYLDGSSLSGLLEKGIDRVTAIRVALAIAEALAAVHKRGLVHRDIKPENVMLALNPAGGRPVDWLKLIDFGVALKAGKVPPDPLGTPEFCPPEQFDRGTAAHPANDVYALGVNLFLLITGRLPFEGDVPTLMRLHHEAPRPSLVTALVQHDGAESLEPRTRALLEDLDELVQQMMAVRLETRPTASDAARALIRLETNFADAGTVVGTVNQATFRHLKPIKSRTRAMGEPSDVDDDVVTDRQPIAAPAPTAAPRPSRVREVMATPGPDVLEPVKPRPSGQRPLVSAPAVEAVEPAKTLEPTVPVGPSKSLIGGLVVLILILGAALTWSIVATPEPTDGGTARTEPNPLRVADPGTSSPEDAGAAIAERIPTEPVDAGLAVAVPQPPDEVRPAAVPSPPDAGAPTSTSKVIRRTPPAESSRCDNVDALLKDYQQRVLEQRNRAKTPLARQKIDLLEDDIHRALKTDGDCRAAARYFNEVKRLAAQ